jgi:hypothetical protein
MLPGLVLAPIWVVCGGIVWKVATSRKGSGPLWAVLGQIFGPFAILFVFSVRPMG